MYWFRLMTTDDKSAGHVHLGLHCQSDRPTLAPMTVCADVGTVVFYSAMNRSSMVKLVVPLIVYDIGLGLLSGRKLCLHNPLVLTNCCVCAPQSSHHQTSSKTDIMKAGWLDRINHRRSSDCTIETNVSLSVTTFIGVRVR